jgi:hypothetical protein
MIVVGGRIEARPVLLPGLGSRFLLHRNFNPGDTTIPDVFVAVTVIDLCNDVPSKTWTKRMNIGLQAYGEDGNIYERNWNIYPDDTPVPEMKWNRSIEDDVFSSLSAEQKSYYLSNREWYDVCYLDCITPLLCSPSFLFKYDFVGFCLKHRRLFYKADGCYRCKLEPNFPEYEKSKLEKAFEEMTWKGWF